MTERKWMYVLRANGESHAEWDHRMRHDVGQRLLEREPTKLQLTVTDAPPPKLNLFPFRSDRIAIVNVFDEGDDPSRFTEVVRDAAAAVSGYAVDETFPVSYPRTWEDGVPTPSPILLTMLRKKPGVSTEEFISRWHDGHTPLSLEVHPLWYYQRNVVREPIIEGSEPSDGIVLEACPTRADLLNPVRFFGGGFKMVPNMLRVANDIKGFLDMKQTQTYYATEYHLRS